MEEAKIEALHDQEVYYEKEISKIQAAIEDSIRNLIFGYEQQVADLRQRIAELEAQLQDD
jgi:chaperonin cofactor prefoldin